MPDPANWGLLANRTPGSRYLGMRKPRVSPRHPRLTAALRRALRTTAASLHRIAQAAGVQPASLLRISRGELGASPELVQAVARTLVQWGERCTRAAHELRQALRDVPSRRFSFSMLFPVLQFVQT